MERLAFVHIMKTAGSFVNMYLVRKVLQDRGITEYNSGAEPGRVDQDWSPEELEKWRLSAAPKAFVHNHVGNWPEDVVRRYMADGWFTFSFARNPGDQWCSFYFWARKKPGNFTQHLELDPFLRNAFSNKYETLQPNMRLPAYWRDLDYISVYSEEGFGAFLRKYFDHEFEPMDRQNASGNRGWDHYRQEGLISDDTADLYLNSPHYAEYVELLSLDGH